MSLLIAAAGGIVIGAAVGYALGARGKEKAKERMVKQSLEEGFRTFIEHHIDGLDRDGEQADALWQNTVSKKKTEMAARQFADRMRK